MKKNVGVGWRELKKKTCSFNFSYRHTTIHIHRIIVSLPSTSLGLNKYTPYTQLLYTNMHTSYILHVSPSCTRDTHNMHTSFTHHVHVTHTACTQNWIGRRTDKGSIRSRLKGQACKPTLRHPRLKSVYLNTSYFSVVVENVDL